MVVPRKIKAKKMSLCGQVTKIRIEDPEAREAMCAALGSNGYPVWVEEKPGRQGPHDHTVQVYYVCYMDEPLIKEMVDDE